MASARQPWLDHSVAMKRKEETDDLLVFGYSCKLFRDDEKALYIDQGKHLIPWMGDDSLKIDRYDVRGTVFDLRPLEPLGGGASDALWTSLSDAERKVEQLCDEERYRALYHNEAEEALYQEEELKRLHKALDPQNSYGQVAYSYDNETNPNESDSLSNKEVQDAGDDEDEPFIPPQELDIPVGMVLPERTKLNAIIEKTATFINSQGPQMEIILKMKQANNPQFSFLSFDCPLHAYYRHLLMAIKTGRYRPKQPKQQQDINDSENTEHYLHPSLASAATRVELAPSIPSISYKPSADCAYSMLVSKIKDRHSKVSDEISAPGSPGDGTRPPGDSTYEMDRSLIILPPADVQVIIDKMASYVIKNGRDFESVVRSKGDERFAFLELGHKFHPYYEHKVRVYQGLEPPHIFNQGSSASSSAGPAKCVQLSMKKKSSENSQRPILLPGYEYSDDSSESDEDEPNIAKESTSKPKLAPVCFSIKKPKEAEILKEVKSALPVEEETSEEEMEVDGTVLSKPSSSALECKLPAEESVITVQQTALSSPEEEMQRLQQMLKEKEWQLREEERLKKLSERRSQDIFQMEANSLSSTSAASQDTLEVTCLGDQTDHMSCIDNTLERKNLPIEDLKVDGKQISPAEGNETNAKRKILNADELINEIAEAEIIDLTEETDDTPKVTDQMRRERKRKAAAFLSSIRKDHPLTKNGGAHPMSDSDAASRNSTPSPPHPKREKIENATMNFHEAGIPRTSLMARLAASTHLPRQPTTEKEKYTKEKSRNRSETGSLLKTTKDRDGKLFHTRSKSKKKKESSPLEFEHERSRSRSRSISYSRSPPYKRRQGDDSDSEQRNRHHRDPHNDHRKKYDSNDANRHRTRHEEERRSHSFGHSHGRGRSRGRGRGRGHSHTYSHSHSHSQIRKADSPGSDSDLSD